MYFMTHSLFGKKYGKYGYGEQRREDQHTLNLNKNLVNRHQKAFKTKNTNYIQFFEIMIFFYFLVKVVQG